MSYLGQPFRRIIDMGKISIVYWSQSGNTQEMAEAIGKGSL